MVKPGSESWLGVLGSIVVAVLVVGAMVFFGLKLLL